MTKSKTRGGRLYRFWRRAPVVLLLAGGVVLSHGAALSRAQAMAESTTESLLTRPGRTAPSVSSPKIAGDPAMIRGPVTPGVGTGAGPAGPLPGRSLTPPGVPAVGRGDLGLPSVSTPSAPSVAAPLTRADFPRPANTLPPITIGVNHQDLVSHRVVRDSLKNAYRLGYRTYGVEVPIEHQSGINAFINVYDQTGNLAQAKTAYWEGVHQYFQRNPEKFGAGYPPEMVRNMDAWAMSQVDENGYIDNMMNRMAIAHDLGMNVQAIDAPHAVWQEHAAVVGGINNQISTEGITSATAGQLQAAGNARNPYIAANLQPGMVAELGAWHVSGGASSVGSLAGGRGLPTISFMAYQPNPVVPSVDGTGLQLFNRAPGRDSIIGAINNTPPLQ